MRTTDRRVLGRTGLLVSRLAFGSLPLSPWVGAISESAGTELLLEAFRTGINLVDTAELYENYSRLAPALAAFPEVRLLTKSYAVTAADLRRSLERARRETGREVIDLFLLHEVESEAQLRGHQAAWAELRRAREDGEVRAIGLSTHRVAALRAARHWPGVEVVLSIVNREAHGVTDGSPTELLAALSDLHTAGVGILGMKILGGGAYWEEPAGSLAFVRDLPFVDALVVGLQSRAELAYDLAVVAGVEPPQAATLALGRQRRRVVVEEWCTGCGQCLEACSTGALTISDGRATVGGDSCLTCGYCLPRCPDLYLKIL